MSPGFPAAGDPVFVPAGRRGFPDRLAVLEHPPLGGWDRTAGGVVVLVHGSLDHAGSFRRVARRLPELGIVAYDRRGYRGSRAAPAASSLQTHVDDLLAVAAAYADVAASAGGVFAVGHSIGGSIVLGAAIRTPGRFGAVGAYEPSLTWYGFSRPGTRPIAPDAEVDAEVERFFSRMVGKDAWARLGARHRAVCQADGPALLADLRSLSGPAIFDIAALRVPGVVATGGPASMLHHREGADWLAARVPGVRRSEIADAAHGAHLTHPDAFAALVREVVSLGDAVVADAH